MPRTQTEIECRESCCKPYAAFLNGVRFQTASDRSLLISFSEQITIKAHQQVTRLLRLLEVEPIPGLRNLHPAYCSLLITFDALKLTHHELEEALLRSLEKLEDLPQPEPRLVEIPVCYGGEFGPDLEEVAALHELPPAEVIALHSSTTYIVYFLGFVPGFAYLGDLPEALATTRLSVPRKVVPPGSVGIAGRQTGVYPLPTPGGWRLLGRTPLQMFRPGPTGGSVLATGDRVRFMPISREHFLAMEHNQESP